jgi:hypothetical protein
MHHWSNSGSAGIDLPSGKGQPVHIKDMANVAANLAVGEFGRLFKP